MISIGILLLVVVLMLSYVIYNQYVITGNQKVIIDRIIENNCNSGVDDLNGDRGV